MGEFAFTCRKEKIHSMWLGVLLAFGCLLVPLAETFVPWFTKPFRDRNDEIIQRGRQAPQARNIREEVRREFSSWASFGMDAHGKGREDTSGGDGKCS